MSLRQIEVIFIIRHKNGEMKQICNKEAVSPLVVQSRLEADESLLQALVFACSFLVLLSLFSLRSTLGLYVRHIGGTPLAVGIFTGILSFTTAILRPFCGRLIDIHGPKYLFVLAGMIAILTPIGHLLISSMPGTAILVLFAGIARALLMTSSASLFLNLGSRFGDTAAMLNLQGLTTVASNALAPATALYVVSHQGFATLHLILAFFALVGLALFYVLPSFVCRSSGLRQGKPPPIDWKALASRSFMTACIPYLAWAVTNGALIYYLPLYGKHRGVTNVGIFFTVYAVVNFSVRAYIPYLMKRMGRKPILLLAFCAVGAGTFGISRFHQIQNLIIPGILYGLGTSAIYAPLATQVVDYMPESQKMAALGIFMSHVDIGQGLAGVALGAMLQAATYSEMFALIGLVTFLAMIAVLLSPSAPSIDDDTGSKV